MIRAARPLLPLLIAVLALSLTAPTAAAAGARFPTQSLGNRGTDVRAIQGLLTAHGYPSRLTASSATTTGLRSSHGRRRPD